MSPYPRTDWPRTLGAPLRPSPADLLIRQVAYDHPDAVALVAALFADQTARYGYADPADADPAAYQPPEGLFLVAYLDGAAVACGGYRTHDQVSATVEVKKMYTLPARRARGYGRCLLTELERHAAAVGARQVILETGVRNHAALNLYTTAAYRHASSYVPGRDPAINRAFIKILNPADPPS